MNSESTQKYVIVGVVGASYGIKGFSHIHSSTSPASNILDYNPWYLSTSSGNWEAVDVSESKVHGNGVVARFANCQTPEDIEAYKGRQIAITREQLEQLDDDEVYWTDLEGCTVITDQGVTLGLVDRLFETGSNDVLVVAGEAKNHLIPYIRDDVIKKIDLSNHVITVDWDPDF